MLLPTTNELNAEGLLLLERWSGHSIGPVSSAVGLFAVGLAVQRSDSDFNRLAAVAVISSISTLDASPLTRVVLHRLFNGRPITIRAGRATLGRGPKAISCGHAFTLVWSSGRYFHYRRRLAFNTTPR